MSVATPHVDGLVVIRDNLTLVNKAREGVEPAYFVDLLKHSGFRKDELAALIGIDPKTVDNYRKSDRLFTNDPAEKILTLHRLFAFGDQLFGATSEFIDWLGIPSPGLGNKSPRELLHSVSGMLEVEKQMMRIAHGYAA
jgi:putative toxin-antitoxin system antitoxin component (TIGR02293 family)